MKTVKDRAMYILASVGEDKNSIEVIEREIIEYAKQKCKEQREICWDNYHCLGTIDENLQSILNAPEPEFE